MTDDQEVSSLEFMPIVQRRLIEKGVSFDRAIASYPLCCPSRATFQTGQYAHNHGVLDNRPPNGGYPAFRPAEALPVWLGRSGYKTAHVGKYMNDYKKDDDIPPGWDRWFGMVEPSSRYFKVRVNDQGRYERFGKRDPRDYSTDLFTDRAVEFIEDREDDQPFYLSIGYVAPHVAKSFQGRGHCDDKGPEPAPRHLGTFDGEQIPRGPSFNENDVSDKPETVRKREKLSGAEFADKTDKYQCRLESLLAVDEGVGEIVDALRRSGELGDTYIVYASDNGFIQGEHRIDGGKAVPYEGAIRIPMIVRGPGVPQGEASAELVSNVDFVPTVLELANATPGIDLDGRSIAPALSDPAMLDGRAVLIESDKEPDPFRGVRTGRYLYVEREKSGESELYDLRHDPNELESIQESPIYARARDSLRSLLERLKDCAGAGCSTTPRLELVAERTLASQPGKCSQEARLALRGEDAPFVVAVKAGVGGRRTEYREASPNVIDVPAGEGVVLVAEAELADGREDRLQVRLDACD